MGLARILSKSIARGIISSLVGAAIFAGCLALYAHYSTSVLTSYFEIPLSEEFRCKLDKGIYYKYSSFSDSSLKGKLLVIDNNANSEFSVSLNRPNDPQVVNIYAGFNSFYHNFFRSDSVGSYNDQVIIDDLHLPPSERAALLWKFEKPCQLTPDQFPSTKVSLKKNKDIIGPSIILSYGAVGILCSVMFLIGVMCSALIYWGFRAVTKRLSPFHS